MKVPIGNAIAPLAGEIKLDLSRLLGSRMLVQATSGAGKSWLLRLLIEQLGPHIQTIVIDPEGEFALTLARRQD